MSFMSLTIYIISIFFLGFSALNFCENRKELAKWNLVRILTFSYIFGCGMMGFLLFWVALSPIESSRLWIFLIFFTSIIFFVISGGGKTLSILCAETENYERKKFHPYQFNLDMVSGIFAALAFIISIVIVSGNVFFTPLWDIDSFALWGFKSKVIFYSSLDKESYFHSLMYGFSHLDYPLLVPFLNAGVHISIGEVSQSLSKILYFPLFLSFCSLLYYSAGKNLKKIFRYCILVLLVSSPAILQWSSAGTADIYIAVFLALSLYYSLSFIDSPSNSALTGFFLANSFLIFTKNEGLPIAILNILILFYCSCVLKNLSVWKIKIILWTVVMILILLPWFIWSSDIPRIHENYPSRIKNLLNAEHLNRIPEIFAAFFRHATNLHRWGLFWLFFLISLTIPQKKYSYIFPLALFFAIFALYILIFIISPWSVEYLEAAALERLLTHLSIPAFFTISAFLLKVTSLHIS